MSIETVNGFYPKPHTLANLYQDFKTTLKEFTHPLKESINHFTKAIKSRSAFKRAISKRTIKRSLLNEQLKQREAINTEEELNHAETLTNHSLFATANESAELVAQGQEKSAKNPPLATVSKIAISS